MTKWYIFGNTRGDSSQRARVLYEIKKRALASSIGIISLLSSFPFSFVTKSTDSTIAGSLDDSKKESSKNDKKEDSEEDAKFDALLESVMNSGETEKVIEGCFDNYISVIHSDHMLDKSQECLDWLVSLPYLYTRIIYFLMKLRYLEINSRRTFVEGNTSN